MLVAVRQMTDAGYCDFTMMGDPGVAIAALQLKCMMTRTNSRICHVKAHLMDLIGSSVLSKMQRQHRVEGRQR